MCKGIKWLLQQRRYCQVTENSNRGERRALTTEGSQIAVITKDQNLHEEYTSNFVQQLVNYKKR